MISHGTDFWLKAAFGLAAVLFLTSLPTWALGVIVVLGVAGKVAIGHLPEGDRRSENLPPSAEERDDAP